MKERDVPTIVSERELFLRHNAEQQKAAALRQDGSGCEHHFVMDRDKNFWICLHCPAWRPR